MPTPTYDLIASSVITSSTANVTFSSIGSGYRDLVLVVNARPVNNDVGLRLRVNSDTGSNYPYVTMYGDGSTAASTTATATSITLGVGLASPNTANTLAVAQFLDYSATDKHKTILGRTNIPTGTYPGVTADAYRWASTSAITAIEVYFGSGNISSGTFYLYGIVS